MKKVIVGMSGGVDSSVCALLLKKQGYEVIGVNLNLLPEKEGCSKCAGLDSIKDAKEVCDKLGIPFYSLDFKSSFKNNVIDYFANEYMAARTPNPCIACNKYVKFEELLNQAINVFNADYIATGHYAKIEYNEKNGRYYIVESDAIGKDQTYVLYNLTQEHLKHILMPLGSYTKEEIRKIAEENSLCNSNKKDSQEICFIEDNDYAKFIEENYNYKSKPGNFVDTNGNILGKHKGLIHYTIGQRRGLGLSLKEPLYVVKLDTENNQVILGTNDMLFSNELICSKVNFMPFEKLDKPMLVTAKVRYSAKKAEATIYPLDNGDVKVIFKDAQRAITPGQAVVFYDENVVVGGGTII